LSLARELGNLSLGHAKSCTASSQSQA
jgi:hypothetical protein